MYFRETKPGNFSGAIESGCKCHINYGNEITYVQSEVEVNNQLLISEDTGYKLDTEKKIWGRPKPVPGRVSRRWLGGTCMLNSFERAVCAARHTGRKNRVRPKPAPDRPCDL